MLSDCSIRRSFQSVVAARKTSSISSLEGHRLRKPRAFRQHELAVDVDVPGSLGGYRQRGIGARYVGAVPADASVEVRALQVIIRPRVGVHGDPLRGDVVEEEEASADRGEDREKTG